MTVAQTDVGPDVRTDFQAWVQQHLRFNFAVGVLEGSFFGFGVGLASRVVIIPLFVANFTDSAALIGLIASVHQIGWHLPQLLTVRYVARQKLYKPITLKMTLQERWPFLALALVALLATTIPSWLALALTFVLFSWHALGSGVTSTPWQSLIGRIMPSRMHGKFFGIQAAGFSVLSILGAFISGRLLTEVAYPYNFMLCFLGASLMMVISFGFLLLLREPDMTTARPASTETEGEEPFWSRLWYIFKRDAAFRWFLAARVGQQFTYVGMSFYTIYSVRHFGLTPDVIGVMTSVMLFGKAIAHPLCGYIGDRFGHRWAFALGALAFAGANLIAINAVQSEWMYMVFALAGIGEAMFITSILSTNLTFGKVEERPYYIGLGNTLIAPFSLLAPIIGGQLVDGVGFSAMFTMTIVAAIVTTAMLTLRSPARFYA